MIILLFLLAILVFYIQIRPLIRAQKYHELIGIGIILTFDFVVAALMVLGVTMPKISNLIFKYMPH